MWLLLKGCHCYIVVFFEDNILDQNLTPNPECGVRVSEKHSNLLIEVRERAFCFARFIDVSNQNISNYTHYLSFQAHSISIYHTLHHVLRAFNASSPRTLFKCIRHDDRVMAYIS